MAADAEAATREKKRLEMFGDPDEEGRERSQSALPPHLRTDGSAEAAAPEAAAAAAPEATPAAQAATTAAEASTEEVSDEEESGEEQRGQYDGRVEEMRGETTEEVSDEEESGEEQRGQHGGMVEEMRGESTEEVSEDPDPNHNLDPNHNPDPDRSPNPTAQMRLKIQGHTFAPHKLTLAGPCLNLNHTCSALCSHPKLTLSSYPFLHPYLYPIPNARRVPALLRKSLQSLSQKRWRVLQTATG